MTIPSWLCTCEHYAPRIDRDTFIAMSTRSMLAVLSVLHGGANRRRPGFAGNATVKILSAFVTVLLLSLTHSIAFICIAGAVFLGLLSIHRAEEIAAVLKRTVPVVGFTILIMIPAAFAGHLATAVMITGKLAVTVGAVSLLSVTTEWRFLSAALATLRVPGLFILVLDITVRYIELLGERALRLLEALALRSVGRNAEKRGSLGGIAGTLFLKSQAMASELYAAMECRGFTGDYHLPRSFRLSPADAVPIASVVILILAFLLIRV